MSEYSYDYSVLVVAEPDFVYTANDQETYFAKLNNFLIKRSGDSNLRVVTVSGRYGLNFDNIIEVDDRNKTSFLRSLDDHLNQFNEIVILANFEKEMFIDALTNRLNELSKAVTIYGYEIQRHEES